MSRVLVAGWFSFTEVVATVGDEASGLVVQGWLNQAGLEADLAYADYLGRGVDLATVDPQRYSHLVWVCGPLIADPLLDRLLCRFEGVPRLAVGVSVLDGPTAARFDQVWARDGAGPPRPDLAAVPPEDAAAPGVGLRAGPPVVATVLAPVQAEYGDRGRHDLVRQTVEQWVAERGLGCFEVATDLLTAGHRPWRFEQARATLARADVVVSSRLHGLVLGLAAGRPVIACDPVAGGAKVGAQARALGWPVLLDGEELTGGRLDDALARCLGPGSPSADWDQVALARRRLRAELTDRLTGRVGRS